MSKDNKTTDFVIQDPTDLMIIIKVIKTLASNEIAVKRDEILFQYNTNIQV